MRVFRFFSILVVFSYFLLANDQVIFNKRFKGDFDQMKERGFVRALVVPNELFYFIDKGRQRGLSYETVKLFEKHINKKYKRKHLKIKLFFIPTTRDKIFQKLLNGEGDMIVANLTVTNDRKKVVDFTDPLYENIDEILVSSKKAPKIKDIKDLSGKDVTVRKSSSYYNHLKKVNERFKKENIKPINIKFAEPYLEDGDLLELVNNDLIDYIFVDSHKVSFWSEVFKNINIYSGIKINSGGKIAIAVRKNSKMLKNELNDFIKTIKKGTLLGNILHKRYLKDNVWIKNPKMKKRYERFEKVVRVFKKYAKKFDLDYLMIVALAFQESELDNSKRSKAGAIGIMQVLRSTANDPNINVKNIEKLENNIMAGTKYIRFIYDRYFKDIKDMDKINKVLFSFASYNAGPAKINRLRKIAKQNGFNPNIWFNNVEVIAAKKIGRETVQYVSNIYKYYVVYKLTMKDK